MPSIVRDIVATKKRKALNLKTMCHEVDTFVN